MTAATFTLNSIATNLPEGSVVATDAKALFKGDAAWIRPWLSTAGGAATNADVDEYLARGATILRRGKNTKVPAKATNGSQALNRLIDTLKVNPAPLDVPAHNVPEIRSKPDLPEPTEDKDTFKLWQEWRLDDESQLTEEQLTTREATCTIRTPHTSHMWGRARDIHCKGYLREPEGLSFGSVVSTISKDGAVENWVKMSEDGNYPWRSPDGRMHGHAPIVAGVKKGTYIVVRWGI